MTFANLLCNFLFQPPYAKLRRMQRETRLVSNAWGSDDSLVSECVFVENGASGPICVPSNRTDIATHYEMFIRGAHVVYMNGTRSRSGAAQCFAVGKRTVVVNRHLLRYRSFEDDGFHFEQLTICCNPMQKATPRELKGLTFATAHGQQVVYNDYVLCDTEMDHGIPPCVMRAAKEGSWVAVAGPAPPALWWEDKDIQSAIALSAKYKNIPNPSPQVLAKTFPQDGSYGCAVVKLRVCKPKAPLEFVASTLRGWCGSPLLLVPYVARKSFNGTNPFICVDGAPIVVGVLQGDVKGITSLASGFSLEDLENQNHSQCEHRYA
eukprot:TRINITY_DN10527_c1_g1_i1.p1 TRINITY_DN10527_c1_g1~~TRINITY_DN10527_c1_g1_i1.p1  ORF type:complete len:321 (+),score=22.89 TRINITY_DN10527_c1_g1_i1:182-1144(+)